MVDDRANVESKKGPFAARTSGEIGHDWPLPQRELSGDGGGGGAGRGPPARAAEALSRVACSFEPINRSPKAPLVVVDFQWSPCLVLPLMLLATISWRLIRSTWAHVLRA